MERKTMGAFIAALRKASGMTQKELAEKLNVSDKSVSRWERDDGAPDLSVIPVIAEVFGVTCDELLRGERRTEAQPAETTARGEKQRKRLLAVSLAQYRNRSFIAMGISIVGLIAAMIGNLGFLRAYIGFFAGCVFFLAAVICQIIFINGAFLSVDDNELKEEEITAFRGKIIALAEYSFGLTLVLFAATLPLVVFLDNAYMGLNGMPWLRTGLIFGAVTLVIWYVVCRYGNQHMVKKTFITMCEKIKQKEYYNRILLIKCIAAVLVLGCLTLLGQNYANSRFSAFDIAGGIEFEDYDSFVTHMGQRVEDDNIVFSHNEYTDDNPLMAEVLILYGPRRGETACTFIWRNQSVHSYRVAKTEDGLPITAITQKDYEQAENIVVIFNIAVFVLYFLEIAGGIRYYQRKRMK